MSQESSDGPESLLALIDLAAIADRGDKVRECEFFLELASSEQQRERFRWLITAYLNAVYSYFETTALAASVGITDPQTGESIEDWQAVEILRAYVKVFQDARRPYYVKTGGLDPVIQCLYKVRAAATHHFPLSIMAAGPNLPEDYEIGSLRGKGTKVLALCRDALAVVKRAQAELDE